MKLLFILLVLSFSGFAQDYVFFDDSPDNTYYDPSFGFNNNGSLVVMINENKFPVEVNTKYSGVNALRLRWRSAPGGEWGIAVAEEGWIPHDVTSKDSITFWTYTTSAIESAALPSIYLEDTQNRKTPKQSLSNYIHQIEKNQWIRAVVPMSLFIESPGSVDLTQIKTIYFGQDSADNKLHVIYLDEIRIVSSGDADTVPPAVPAGLTAEGFQININLTWQPNSENDLAGYRIYRAENGEYKLIGFTSKTETEYIDNTGIPPKTFSYKISAYDLNGNESSLSEEASATTISAPDSVLLDMVQETTFKYFWDYAHPVSGLARERLGSGETVTSGGSGFGIMALPVGVERGYITREQAVERMLKILNFLSTKADRFHGVFSHWLNGTTGTVIPFSQKDNGGDLVETAFMIQGLLTVRQYFNQDSSEEEQIRNLITAIWEAVEWDWYRRDPNSNFLYWHWSPNYNWDMNFRLQGPNETMICYLLAIASPTHPIPASLYHSGWASSSNYTNGKTFYGIPLEVGWDYGGPLFFAHYSFLGFDPRNKKDAYTNYFINNRNHALIHQAHSTVNPGNFPGYDADTWGLTASDGPFGYSAREPSRDDGTIAPTAALSSMPYTPEESMAALKSFYYEYGSGLWGEYGFKDAFNLKENWFAGSYLAIDQGPIIVMIENFRSQLLWNNFMANPEIQPMLDSIGFVYDSTTVDVGDEKSYQPVTFQLYQNYPNPFNPTTSIQYAVGNKQFVSLKVYDILGNEIATLVNEEKSAGEYTVKFSAGSLGNASSAGHELSSGIYFYVLNDGGKTLSKKMCLMK